MKINAKFRADFASLKLHYHEDTDTRWALVGLRLKVDEKTAEGLFGEELRSIAFAGAHEERDGDGEAQTTFGYASLKPALKCEMHVLKLDDKGPYSVQPELYKLAPVKGEPSVLVDLRLPIVIQDSRELAGDLACAFGKIVDVDLRGAQQELPGMVGPAIRKRAGRHGNAEPMLA